MADDDCRTCGHFRPGAGCMSELEMACGCCYFRATIMDRLRLMYKTARHWMWVILPR